MFQSLLDNANHALGDNDVPMQLYLAGLYYENDTKKLVVKDRAERLRIANRNQINGSLNVHIYVDGGNEFFWDTNAIFIERRVYTPTGNINTFTHEVGHYFGLLHTHFGHATPCIKEPVTRQPVNAFCFNDTNAPRCSVTGDLICDTPADPKMNTVPPEYWPSRNGCKWEYYLTDFMGKRYWPQVSNYMAYGNAGCESTFTEGQRGVMLWFANLRANIAQTAWGVDHRNNNSNQVDVYEPDNSHISAREVVYNEWQDHTFHEAGIEDTEDWYRFTFRNEHNLGDLTIEVEELSFNAVLDIEIMEQEVSGLPGPPLQNIQRVQALPQTRKLVFPCTELLQNLNYFIRVRRGTRNGEYRIRFGSPGKDAYLYGPSLLCKDQQGSYGVAEIDGIPAETSFLWGFNTGMRAVTSTFNGPEFVAEATGTVNGGNSISLSMRNSCGTISLNHPIYTGTPSIPLSVTGPATADPGELLNYWGEPAPGASGHYWIVPANDSPCSVDDVCWQIKSSNGASYLKVVTGYNSGYIMLRGTNACGLGDSRPFWVDINTPDSPDDGTTGGGPCVWCRTELAPNPSDTEFEISFLPAPGQESVEMPDWYTVRIFDHQNVLLYEKSTRARKWQVPVQHFAPGPYILQIESPEGVETRHVLVE